MPDRDPVDNLLRRSTAVEIPADVEARMRRQFTDFRSRLEQRRHPLRELAASLAGQRPIRWAAATVALATVLAIVFFAAATGGGRVYAAAASRLASARSVQYTVEVAPFVSVEFSHLAPAHDRIQTSWGIEIRTDGSDAQLVLLHASRQYVREQRDAAGLARSVDLVEQLMALPETADAVLGERWVNGRRLLGYRVMGTRMPGQHGVESLDLWIDAASGTPDHVDVTPAGAGTSGYRMQIRDIRVDVPIDPALFDMTPPAGYADVGTGAAVRPELEPSIDAGSLQPQITQVREETAVVLRMRGSYLQATSAVATVSQHLQQRSIVPAGPAFGRFESESRWEVGYPVPAGTTTDSPFQVVTLPGGAVASLVVNGPWGRDSAARWSRLLGWVVEHGFIPVGPPIEAWSGDAARPDAQVTEMRIAIAPAPR
jgi:effector-binding domain-containing protein